MSDICVAQNKQEVIAYINDAYPEYFSECKVTQRLTKKMDQMIYIQIYELDDYWRKYWKTPVKCMVCGNEVPLISTKMNLQSFQLKKFICSKECAEKRQEEAECESDEYWNNRSDYHYIYKITNKHNKKVYIGFTSREPIFRWWEHFKHSNLPIGKALKEEGITVFTFEVLEIHSKKDKTVEQMHEIETRLIRDYDSIKNGYNCVISKQEND